MRLAFTLIELMISVVLIALIVLFLYGALGGSKQTNQSLERESGLEYNRTMIYELMYRDLIESVEVTPMTTRDKRFTILNLQTSNSLYGIAMPYVTYYVHSQNLDLVRLESAQKITLPISYENKWFVHSDIIAKEITDFNIYTAKLSNSSGDVNASERNTTRASIPGVIAPPSPALSSSDEQNASSGKKRDDHFLLYLNAKKLTSILLEIAF